MARESHCTLCFTGLSQTKDKAVRTALLHARPEDMRVGVVFIYEDDPRTERVRQDIKALVGAGYNTPRASCHHGSRPQCSGARGTPRYGLVR